MMAAMFSMVWGVSGAYGHPFPWVTRRLTASRRQRYASPASAQSDVDLGGSSFSRRNSAPSLAGAIFMPAMRYGGCARDAFGLAGFL